MQRASGGRTRRTRCGRPYGHPEPVQGGRSRARSSAAPRGSAVPMPVAMASTTTVDRVALVDLGLISGRGGFLGGLEYQRSGERGGRQDCGRRQDERGRNCDAYQRAAEAPVRNHLHFLTRLHSRAAIALVAVGDSRPHARAEIPFGRFHRSVASADFPRLGFAPHAVYAPSRGTVAASEDMADITSDRPGWWLEFGGSSA